MVAVLVLGWWPTSAIGRNRRTRRLSLTMIVVVVLMSASTYLFVGTSFFVTEEGGDRTIITGPTTRWAIVIVPSATAATERIETCCVVPPSVVWLTAVLHLRVVRRSAVYAMI
jgi:hypothetical protein